MHTATLHLIAPIGRHRTGWKDIFPTLVLSHRGRREELGIFTEIIGSTVLFLMFYNAGI